MTVMAHDSSPAQELRETSKLTNDAVQFVDETVPAVNGVTHTRGWG